MSKVHGIVLLVVLLTGALVAPVQYSAAQEYRNERGDNEPSATGSEFNEWKLKLEDQLAKIQEAENSKRAIKETIELINEQKEPQEIPDEVMLAQLQKDWQERDKKLVELLEKELSIHKSLTILEAAQNGETPTADDIRKIDEKIIELKNQVANIPEEPEPIPETPLTETQDGQGDKEQIDETTQNEIENEQDSEEEPQNEIIQNIPDEPEPIPETPLTEIQDEQNDKEQIDDTAQNEVESEPTSDQGSQNEIIQNIPDEPELQPEIQLTERALQEANNKQKIKEALELIKERKELQEIRIQMILVQVQKDWQERDKKLLELQEKEKKELNDVLLTEFAHNGKTLTPDVVTKINTIIDETLGIAKKHGEDKDNFLFYLLKNNQNKHKGNNNLPENCPDGSSPPCNDNPPENCPDGSSPPCNDNPPDNNPPDNNPPADNPPADNPPADNPPADNPPADNPPADNPPADNPPADNPPADNPPADNPPADNPSSKGKGN